MPSRQNEQEALRQFRQRLDEIAAEYPELCKPENQERFVEYLLEQKLEDDSDDTTDR